MFTCGIEHPALRKDALEQGGYPHAPQWPPSCTLQFCALSG